jgi:hypothetical protein
MNCNVGKCEVSLARGFSIEKLAPPPFQTKPLKVASHHFQKGASGHLFGFQTVFGAFSFIQSIAITYKFCF